MSARPSKENDKISELLERLTKGSTLNLLYLVVALFFIGYHLRFLEWVPVRFTLLNHTLKHPKWDLNTKLLLSFFVWFFLIYLGPSNIKKHTDEDIVQKQLFLKRLWHRISITYFIEIVCLYLGVCLLIEKSVFELPPLHWSSPWPEVIQEAGVALIIAAILSAMYEVQHREGSFGKPVKQIRDLTKKLEIQVEEANRLTGYLNYRKAIQIAYGGAKQRIISVSDYWILDQEWWEEGIWERCPLYINLQKCYDTLKASQQAREMRVVFAGNVPWPDAETCVFTEPDFERFMGVVWRLVVAHKLREKFALNKQDTIRVVVATVPVPATIVDDEVFIFLQGLPKEALPDETAYETPDPLERARGTRIADGTNRETADAYEAMIYSYLRHVRSAREYVEAILYYAALHCSLLGDELVQPPTDPPETSGQPDADQVTSELHVNRDNIARCLDSLGANRWAAWKARKDCLDRDSCTRHAVLALEEFCRSSNVPFRRFEDLRRDLL